VNLGARSVGNGISVGAGLVIELSATISGLAIGLTITLDIYMGGPYTGAAMNPARAFGPELADNFWSDGWIYWVGPLLGAAIAAFAYDRMYLRGLAPEPPGPPETGLEEPRPGDAASI
jgi:aquaporin TIP